MESGTWTPELRVETKMISHLSVVLDRKVALAMGASRTVWFTDGTWARTWLDGTVVHALGDTSLIGVPVEVTFQRDMIVDVKRAETEPKRQEADSVPQVGHSERIRRAAEAIRPFLSPEAAATIHDLDQWLYDVAEAALFGK